MQTKEGGEVISALRSAPELEQLWVLQRALHSELPQVRKQVLPSALLLVLVPVQPSVLRPLPVSAC
jgi:hypothetical protein